MKPIEQMGAFPLILGGHILWGAGFFTIYATHAGGCELGWHEAQALGGFSALRLVLMVMTIVLNLVLVLLIVRTWRLPGEASGSNGLRAFTVRAGRYSMLAAAASVALNFFVVFWLPLC